MGQQTTTIATVRFFRQDDKPPSAPDGATWVTPSDGAGNDTSSRYNYDAAAERWELESAVGPSEPTLGTPVAGATWRDTATGEPKQYDGTAFTSLSVSFNSVEVEPNTTHTFDGEGYVYNVYWRAQGYTNAEVTVTITYTNGNTDTYSQSGVNSTLATTAPMRSGDVAESVSVDAVRTKTSNVLAFDIV